MDTLSNAKETVSEAHLLSTRVPYTRGLINNNLNVIRARQANLIASGTTQDILKSFGANDHDFEKLPDHFHMTITDPIDSIVAVELLRQLVDRQFVPYEKALPIVQNCFSFKLNKNLTKIRKHKSQE